MLVFGLYSLAGACKYTVRDIGFADLDSKSYKLCFYVDDQVPVQTIKSIEYIAYAAFLESNVNVRIINMTQQANDPLIEHYRSSNIVSGPAVILIDSQGRSTSIPYSFKKKNMTESLWRLMENIVSTPLRSRITEILTTRFAAVLLIEGQNKNINTLARRALSEAVANIIQVMTLMPKPVDKPPELLTISEQEALDDSVLLWSLEFDSRNMEDPQVCVLYGRGRRIGPVLKGKEITNDNIFNLLSVIGADCECGLDRSVMLGKMIPLRWEKAVQEDLITHLGFDVENPLIRSEMQQILMMNPVSQSNRHASNPLSVYREGIIKLNPSQKVPTMSANRLTSTAVHQSPQEDISSTTIILISLSSLVLIVLFLSGFIFLQKSKRN